ncbi:NfeD family protein [Yimella sp. RIT 621]|uniref:Membrane protein implicated in regulation of membrane protease activity n=1 Tax=Yimella lutea TaxID=587872 RepID=A0A542EEL4_9MICO|nr:MULTISPECIES: NfeD family protein [Yimella]RYG76104.1 NfeD family protein [Yimella sp. RIT 621]TQJ13765.1 membrane protein implicated in regulation of membrane protease activity [Yimella lutea]
MDWTTLFWIVAGLALIGLEVLGGEFVLLMLGGGALAAAGTSAAGADTWVSAVVFAVVSISLLLLVRPPLKRHFLSGPMHAMNTDALLGARAEVVEQVTEDGGLVRIGGDIWTARPARPDMTFEPGEKLVVDRIDGAVAVVDSDNFGEN